MSQRRRIAYDDTSCGFFEVSGGGYVIVLFDTNDRPIYKLSFQEAHELIEEATNEDRDDDIWLSRRVHKLLYERAITDGVILRPDPSIQRPFAM